MSTLVKFQGDGDTVLVEVAAGDPVAQAVFTVSTINESIDNGEYWTFSTPGHDYHVWYNTPGSDGDPQDPARPDLAALSSVAIPVTFPSSAIASTIDAAQATVEALNKLTGEVSASLVNNSTIQVAIKEFADVTDAADVTAGVTVTIDASGVAPSVIDITHVILGDDGRVADLAIRQEDGTFDIHGSTYNLLELNPVGVMASTGTTIVGTDLAASGAATATKSDNLVASNGGFGGLGSSISGVL